MNNPPNSYIPTFSLVTLLLLACSLCGQPQSVATTSQPADQAVHLTVGKDTVIHRGPWTSETRKTNRPADLWLYYQHGVVDHFATPFTFEQLLGENQPAKKWLDRSQPIDTPYKQSTQAAIRCVRSDRIELANPLPIPMDRVRGKRIRIFFWMKGNDAGAKNNTWHCPDVDVIIKDSQGRVLSSNFCFLKSQRTFPWHCFYTDRFVPNNAGGVYLRLYNKFHGVAWFSSPSWKVITEHNTYTADEQQDPHTGSLSKNPLHEALAYHTRRATKYPWRFLLGSDIGMKGHTHNITTRNGLTKYYTEKARKHPDEMNHAILHLGAMYHQGMSSKLLPPMENGWMEHLGKLIIDDQDPKTGYWHDGFNLSLGLTFHLCDAYFRYYRIPRADRPDLTWPTRDLGLKRVPRAKQIVETTLMMQSSYIDPQDVKRKAAWNAAAYRYTTTPDASRDKCWFASTWDAIVLLRQAGRYVDQDMQRQVYTSVKAAFRYILHEMVYDDGTFRQRDTDNHPTKPSYMNGMIGDSSYLERRILPSLSTPTVTAVRSDDTLMVTWSDPREDHNSLRIYAVPKELPADKIDESHLVGIIHKIGKKIYEMDPFLATQKIRHAANERWGTSLKLPPADNWRGKRYLPWKLRKIHFPLACNDDLKPLSLKIEASMAIYVSAATWYGEESPPLRITPARSN